MINKMITFEFVFDSEKRERNLFNYIHVKTQTEQRVQNDAHRPIIFVQIQIGPVDSQSDARIFFIILIHKEGDTF